MIPFKNFSLVDGLRQLLPPPDPTPPVSQRVLPDGSMDDEAPDIVVDDASTLADGLETPPPRLDGGPPSTLVSGRLRARAGGGATGHRGPGGALLSLAAGNVSAPPDVSFRCLLAVCTPTALVQRVPSTFQRP